MHELHELGLAFCSCSEGGSRGASSPSSVHMAHFPYWPHSLFVYSAIATEQPRAHQPHFYSIAPNPFARQTLEMSETVLSVKEHPLERAKRRVAQRRALREASSKGAINALPEVSAGREADITLAVVARAQLEKDLDASALVRRNVGGVRSVCGRLMCCSIVICT